MLHPRPGGLAAVMLLAAALLLATNAYAGQPQLRLNMTTPATLDTGTFGSNGDEAIGVSFILRSGGVANGPFTTRTTLPPGVTYAGMNASTPAWSCVSAPPEVVCTYTATLTAANWQSGSLAIWVDTAQDLPVPGSAAIRTTIESAELPLPNPPVCVDVPSANVATSDTGCVERTVQHRQSELRIVQSAWGHWTPTLVAGDNGSLSIGLESIGYSENNGTVTLQVLLPPGITRYGGMSSPPFACNNGTPNAQGQLVTCTTAYLYDGQNQQTANLTFFVDVAPDVAIPGPLPVYATIFNAIQPPRAFSLCDDVPMIFGCGYYNGIVTAPAPQPQLDFTAVTHAPLTFLRGQEASVRPEFANFGNGNAGAMTMHVAAPAGFAWNRRGNTSPAGTCTAAGSAQSGQIVTCQYPQGLPPGGSGYAGFTALVFDVLRPQSEDATFVFAIGDTLRPGPTLESCASDPAQVGCAIHTAPVAPWIFCDGFESLPHVCGRPQPFD